MYRTSFPEHIPTRTSIKNSGKRYSVTCIWVVSNLPYSDEKLEQIRNATINDSLMSLASKLVKEGWPDHRRNVPEKTRSFWNHRHELSEYDGLILKGSQIVIPHALRKEMLGILHESQFGIEKTCNLAKDIMF